MTDIDGIGRVCFALHARMTARVLTRTYDYALRPLGLKVPQFGILGAISDGADISETALADRLGLERTTLVRNLKVLADRGWIEPVPCAGRGLGHRLTPQGEATLRRAVPLWRSAQERIETNLASIDPDSARHAMRALRKAAYAR